MLIFKNISTFFQFFFKQKLILILFNLLCSSEFVQKGDFANLKVPNRDFSTKSVPDQCGLLEPGIPIHEIGSNCIKIFNIARCIVNSICLMGSKLHLANIKEITGLTASQLSLLSLPVFGPNTSYNYNLSLNLKLTLISK